VQLQRVVIGVCTYKRPNMLRSCLDSLGRQIVPADLAVEIVVADNEEQMNARAGVEAFATGCPFAVHYVHQPKRGIAAARNAILEKAVALGADWIAMLDDDEAAAPDWIVNLMAPEYRGIPILRGKRIYVFPSPAPFWAREKERRDPPEGAPITRVSTNNVRFSAKLVRKAGLRFDESIGLSGGEDHRFFRAARKAGFAAHATNKAITYETAHPERLTFRYMMLANYRFTMTRTYDRLEHDGQLAVLIQLAMSIPGLFMGLGELAVCPLAAVFGRYRFKQFALRGAKRFTLTAGIVSALSGVRRDAYRHVVGN
jgi:succinoglycan biosynthesis protein ExoM